MNDGKPLPDTTPVPKNSPPISLGSDLGFQYYKLSIERADAAWEKIHTITRWNFAALAAAIVLMSTNYEALGLPAVRLAMICGFVVVSSLVASALAYMHCNYAYWLYGYAWIAEKRWLGNRESEGTIEKIRQHRNLSALTKGDSIPLNLTSMRDMVKNIHVITNLIPALVAIVSLILIEPVANSPRASD